MSGVLGAAEHGAVDASHAAQDASQTSHVGLSDFQKTLTEHTSDIGTLRTGQDALDGRVQQQGQDLNAARTDIGQLQTTMTARNNQLNDLDGRANNTEQGLQGQRATLTAQDTTLRGHDTRLTNLEAGQAQNRQPFAGTSAVKDNTGQVTSPATGEIVGNNAQIDALRAVHDQNITSFKTGHGSGFRDGIDHAGTRISNQFRANKEPLSTPRRDDVLQRKIQNDPTVRLQQAKLSGAIDRMEQANQPGATGNRADFIKAAEDAEKSAKDLDAARRSIESTAVFQSGNSFSKHVTKVNAAIAGISLAAAGTTGGLIAANNETQREKTDKA